MSAKIMGSVWDCDLPRNKTLVLLAMADHADHRGYNVFPSIGLIAWKTGYSYRQTLRIIKELEADGVLIPMIRGKELGRSNRYRIDLEQAPKKKPYRDEKPAGENEGCDTIVSHPCDGVTSEDDGGGYDTIASYQGVTSSCHTGCDTIASHITVNEPSNESSDASPSGEHQGRDEKSTTTPRFEVGATVYYTDEPQPGSVTVLAGVVLRHTPRRTWVRFGEGDERCLKDSSLSESRPALERKTDRLADAILYHILHIGRDQRVGKSTMQVVNRIKGDLQTSFPNLTEREFHDACMARGTQYVPGPDAAKIVKMVSEHLETTGRFKRNGHHDYAPPDPDCPLCGGAGLVLSAAAVGEPGYGQTIICECRQQAAAEVA